jgi:hypothetical protein
MRRLAAAVLLVAAGCGTTYVLPSDPGARVWVDGEMVGKGQGEVRQRGLPGRATVVVKTEDGRRQDATLSRSFTLTTFFLGFITYGVCWVACWEYPLSLAVTLPPGPGAQVDAYSGRSAPDPWLQAPPGWQPKTP